MPLLSAVKPVVKPVVEPLLDKAAKPKGQRSFTAEFERDRAAGCVAVNIGSGGKPLAGWINCDITRHAPTYLDATRPWPLPEGSVDLIYADNVIEHIPLALGRHVFEHAFNALKPGGVFRLATPDVEAVARQYLENGELARLGMERNREKGRDFVFPVQLLQQVFVGAKHYLGFCYDYASLSAVMVEAGFETRRCAPRESEREQLRGLEARTHPAEEATGLIVEGVKPL